MTFQRLFFPSSLPLPPGSLALVRCEQRDVRVPAWPCHDHRVKMAENGGGEAGVGHQGTTETIQQPVQSGVEQPAQVREQ